jgi:hypothetical protein
MTYSQLAGALAMSSTRLGVATTIWCPILLVCSIGLFAAAVVCLRRKTAFPSHPREH